MSFFILINLISFVLVALDSNALAINKNVFSKSHKYLNWPGIKNVYMCFFSNISYGPRIQSVNSQQATEFLH